MIHEHIRREIDRQLAEGKRFKMLSTVWHTGTESLEAERPGYVRIHCGPLAEALSELPQAEVITTYRDPLRVAAAWVNRNTLSTPDHYATWVQQWLAWGEIAKRATIYDVTELTHRLNSRPDRFGLHKMLDEGDMDQFYSVVPKELIDLAREAGGTHGIQKRQGTG